MLNKNEVKMVSEVPMTVFAGRKLCAIDFQLAYFHTAVHSLPFPTFGLIYESKYRCLTLHLKFLYKEKGKIFNFLA